MSYRQNRGFTLLELMIALSVLIVALSGLMAIFTGVMSLNERAKKLTLGITACQDKMEEIRNASFTNIYTVYNGASFDPSGFAVGQAKGAIYINNTDPKLLQVYISISWKERSNKIVGEDTNLNGIRDAGEDSNTNGRLDSPAQIATLMAEI